MSTTKPSDIDLHAIVNNSSPAEFIDLYLFVMTMGVGKFSEFASNLGESTKERENTEWLDALRSLYGSRPDLFYFLLSQCSEYQLSIRICEYMGVKPPGPELFSNQG